MDVGGVASNYYRQAIKHLDEAIRVSTAARNGQESREVEGRQFTAQETRELTEVRTQLQTEFASIYRHRALGERSGIYQDMCRYATAHPTEMMQIEGLLFSAGPPVTGLIAAAERERAQRGVALCRQLGIPEAAFNNSPHPDLAYRILQRQAGLQAANRLSNADITTMLGQGGAAAARTYVADLNRQPAGTAEPDELDQYLAKLYRDMAMVRMAQAASAIGNTGYGILEGGALNAAAAPNLYQDANQWLQRAGTLRAGPEAHNALQDLLRIYRQLGTHQRLRPQQGGPNQGLG